MADWESIVGVERALHSGPDELLPFVRCCFDVFDISICCHLHPKIKPSKINICLKMPFWTPEKGQGGPKMAQDGPKKGRGTTTRAPKMMLEAILGPSWGFVCVDQLARLTM